MLAVALVAIYPIPVASACHVSLHDPTNPSVSEDCKDPENWTDGEVKLTITVEPEPVRTGIHAELCPNEAGECMQDLASSVMIHHTDNGTETRAQADAIGMHNHSMECSGNASCETLFRTTLEKNATDPLRPDRSLMMAQPEWAQPLVDERRPSSQVDAEIRA